MLTSCAALSAPDPTLKTRDRTLLFTERFSQAEERSASAASIRQAMDSRYTQLSSRREAASAYES